MFAAFAISFGVGGWLVSANSIDAGGVLNCFSQIAVAILKAIPQSTSHYIPANKEFKGKIEFRNVYFRYPSRPDTEILNDFNLIIQPGEKVAIMAPSGSGKSTLLALLLRLYDPQKGSIFVDGINIAELDIFWLRQQFGYVSQDTFLFDGTVYENLTIGEKGTKAIEDVVAACAIAQADEFIAKLPQKYHTMLKSDHSVLSGGQKQRLTLARAFLRNPNVFLLDEATSALDAVTEGRILSSFREHYRDRTALIVTHRTAPLLLADKIVLLSHGINIAQGTHAELLISSAYYRQVVEKSISDDITVAKIEEKGARKSDHSENTANSAIENVTTKGNDSLPLRKIWDACSHEIQDMAFFFDVSNSAHLESIVMQDCSHIERLAGPLIADIFRALLTTVRRASIEALDTVKNTSFKLVYSVRAIRILSAEGFFLNNYLEKLINCERKSMLSLFVSSSLGWPLRDALVILFSALGLRWAGHYFLLGYIDQHSIWVVLTTLTITAINTLNILGSMSFGSLGESALALRRVFEVVERIPSIDIGPVEDIPKSSPEDSAKNASVDFKDVDFVFPNRTAKVLSNFCLKIPAGKSVVILGESGSGKSTAISLIMRLFDPNSGTILIGDDKLGCVPLYALRNRVTMIWQETEMFNWSVYDNITLGKKLSLDAVKDAAKVAGAHDFIEALSDGYNTKVGEKGCLLSGGQKQRIGLARCFALQPEVILMDEATSALHKTLESKIMESILSLPGSTKIIVTHRAGLAKDADLVAIVKDGRVSDIGTHSSLISTSAYYKALCSKKDVQ
ncbi:hypothetical protein HDU97_005381 [Phlyctochytrium planicorne]|nr:hypothetical protein HDU97_005381 [Phlyctochytrium planicorne]